MQTALYSIASVLIVSLASFSGVFALTLKQEKLEKLTKWLVALSAGTLLGDAFLHLLPEAVEGSDSLVAWFSVLAGMMAFFILEKIVFWHHCHLPTDSHKHLHRIGTMNVVGDALHNFVDGVIIAGSFLVSVPLGIATSLAVIAHEIPQEISDFGILIYSGFTKSKALLYNFLSALAAVAGVVFTFIALAYTENLIFYIVPFTAGAFVYIASADLIPELHKETAPRKSARQLMIILLGIFIMWVLKILFE